MYNRFLEALKEWDISVNSSVAIFIGLLLLVRLVIWLLKAAGVYKLSVKEKIKKPALCFLPFVYQFKLGRLAEKCNDEKAQKPTKYSKWLLFLSILITISYAAFFVVGVISFTTITQFALKAIELDTVMTINMFTSAIYAICFYFTALVIYVCYFVLYRVAFWRILKQYCGKKSKLYIIISILIPPLTPILIFIISAKEKRQN